MVKEAWKIYHILKREFQKNPEKLKRSYPAVYKILEKERKRETSATSYIPWSLTVEEKEEKKRKIFEMVSGIDEMKEREKKKVARNVLAMLGMLEEFQTEEWYRNIFLRMVEIFGWKKEKNMKKVFLEKEKPERVCTVLGGFKLGLRLPGILVFLKYSAKDYERVEKAKKGIGIFEDGADVSIKHDFYLYGERK